MAGVRKFLESVFSRDEGAGKKGDKPSEHRMHVATAALLLEIANSDDEFSDVERAQIIDTLKDFFELSDEEVDQLLAATREEVNTRIDLYHFTNLINENFSKPDKLVIIEMVWRVIYADKHLDGHEDYLVHRIAKLLRLQHSDMIDAKLRVKRA